MKNLIIVLFYLTSLSTFGQTSKVEFDGNKWNAPYTLNFPNGWDVERFLIPIEFAPQIPYKGVEDIRFTPGWGNVKSDEYWTYAFLWYLDETPKTNAKIIENNLKAYYTGLVGRNIVPRKIQADKLVPVITEIKKVTISIYFLTVLLLGLFVFRILILTCLSRVSIFRRT